MSNKAEEKARDREERIAKYLTTVAGAAITGAAAGSLATASASIGGLVGTGSALAVSAAVIPIVLSALDMIKKSKKKKKKKRKNEERSVNKWTYHHCTALAYRFSLF